MPPPSTILTPLKSPSASSRRPAREWRACPCGSLKQKLLPDSLWEKPAHPSTYTDMSEVGSLGPASEINAKIKRVKALAPCLVMNVGALPSSLPSNSALDMGIKRPSEGRRLAQDSRAKQRSMENPSLSTPPPFSPGSRMQLRPTFGSTKGPQLHPETVRPSLPAAAIHCRILPSRLFCTQPFTTSLRQQKNCGLAISCWEHR
ncbi:uncharacterized protein LOC118603973 isoform X2 [Rousettus aegyptiacus]|uniref:uncharacterized protein LOC118603973 isoform X2 n=1 Tax=Rousettus aegyptiacus TaxID=9407 RepID=UPI00168D2187|nr:uncharacterized protein LOC118603973 isoform X2 [Rousettus aegyptiacus]